MCAVCRFQQRYGESGQRCDANTSTELVKTIQDSMARAEAALAMWELWSDRDSVLVAVAQDGGGLLYATPELQCNRDIVLAAVAQDGDALYFAAAELQSDPELVRLQALNPRTSAPLLAAQHRLRLAFTCQERLGCDCALTSACVPLEVIELIGKHCTTNLAVLGLVRAAPDV